MIAASIFFLSVVVLLVGQGIEDKLTRMTQKPLERCGLCAHYREPRPRQ